MIRNSLFSFSSLAALAPLSLAVSVFYDLVYFRVFGLSLSVIPSSLNSHFKSALDFVVYAVGMVFLVFLFSIISENNERKVKNAVENHSDSWIHFLREHATTLISAVLCFVIATVSPKWQTNILYIFACHQFVFFLLVAGRIRFRNELGSTGLIWTHTLLTFATLLTAFSVYSALSIKNETGRSHITLATCQQCYLMRVYDDFFMFWDASDRTVKVISKNEIKTLTIPVK